MIEAVIFDMDGVLIDSEPVWEKVRRAYVEEHGGYWGPGTQHRLMGMNTAEWAAYLSGELEVGLPPEEVAADVIDAVEERYRSEIPYLPGAVEAVRRIGARWPLGLASSSPRRLIDAVLEASGTKDLFAFTVSSDEVGRGKPAPDVYLTAASGLGVKAESCAAVEDSTNGLRSAADAGCVVVAVPRPDFPPTFDALGQAALVLNDLDSLAVEALEKLG